MEIFGVGPLEFLMILVLALVILGPEDMVGTSRKIGQWIYRIVRSPTWRAIISTTQDLRELPQKIVREAGIEDAVNEIKDTATQVKTELNATTSEISSEMRAAGAAVSSEMGTAVATVKNDAGIPVPILAGYTSPSTDFTPWPESILAKRTSDGLPTVAEIIRTSDAPYVAQLGFFASALMIGPKSSINLEYVPQSTHLPLLPLQAPELFAGALGLVAEQNFSQAAPAEYESGPAFPYPPEPMLTPIPEPEMEVPPTDELPVDPELPETSPETAGLEVDESSAAIDAPLPDWARGVPTGLTESIGMSKALEERMRQMDEALERLEAKNKGEEIPENNEPDA